ncbi:NlpC/P60 family protein [Paenibacillus antri]|uniref:NlpC/P60 family protein n=1 Tax=Paenibacillus antri TaxID=2582848 RepID=A0A5R9G755_9BACL|nr:C40 family peptidase [Paenibacillus antri]TLS50899.1 NlpC/P60 family protein [Paenibacillus antri]
MKMKKALTIVAAAAIALGALPLLPSEADASPAVAKSVINNGLDYLGTPYEFGSSRSNTRTFDCSDFTRQAFREGARITLPSDSRGQAEFVKKVGETTKRWQNLKKGDLMFFMSYRGSDADDYRDLDKDDKRITHVGIYMGDGKVLHTFSEDEGVTVSKIDGTHWEHRFLFGGSAIR